jgi:hypothetical protein
MLTSQVRSQFPETNFDTEVRATSTRSIGETTEILSRLNMRDLRKIGCPDSIFEFVLEQRNAKRELVELRSSGELPAEADNLDGRAAMELRLKYALQS